MSLEDFDVCKRALDKLKEPWPDEPCDILGPSVEKDTSSWQEKYKGKTRSTDYAM